MFSIYNNFITTLSNNSVNLYFFTDFFFTDFFITKNIIFNLNDNIFNFQNLKQNNVFFHYNLQNITGDLFYNSITKDYLNYISNTFSFCFNFNNNVLYTEIYNNFYLTNFYTNNFSYKILSTYFFKSQLLSYSSYFLFLITLCFFFLFIPLFNLLFNNKLNLMYKNEKFYDDYNTVVNYIIESEKELGSLDDMFIGVSVLICVYGWFFFGTIFFNLLTSSNFFYLYTGLPLFLFTVLSMPTNMIWNYGIFYPIYLRGSSNTTLLFLEFMYDILATGIMYIRLFVQNVRFILMFFAFFECFEFFLNIIFINKNYYSADSTSGLFCIFYNTVTIWIQFAIYYIYNVAHLVYTVISHFFAYLILVFWFFSFLYTTFLNEKLEILFKIKKS